MKKTFVILSFLLSVSPLLVLADDGPSFNCWSPKLTQEELESVARDYVELSDRYNYDSLTSSEKQKIINKYKPSFSYLDPDNKKRATCKKIEINNVVSLDPVLQSEYLLGSHQPLSNTIDDDYYSPTKYSESLSLTSSTSRIWPGGLYGTPTDFAIFDKSYFIPLLSRMFKKENLSFLENNFQNVDIFLFNKSEMTNETIQSHLRENKKIDSVNVDTYNTYDKQQVTRYRINTYNYQEYGKYIHAPKGELIESQYVDIEGWKNPLTENDLQITYEAAGHWGQSSEPVVPITSPLKSITNFWVYTKKDNKLVLRFNKIEFSLDNGKVKTITKDDKNVSASMLFSDSSTSTSEVVSTSSIIVTPAVEETQNNEGFISKIISIIMSWFK
jgi:hypothetical protein